MPKIVDHDARRDDFVAAAQRVIARQGLLNATTREIAREAGYANGALAHYFPDKEAVLRAARRSLLDELANRVRRRAAGLSGLAALRAVLMEVLPLDEADRRAQQVELAFWGQALGDPEAAADYRLSGEEWRALLRHLVAEAKSRGELPGVRDVSMAAELLLVMIDGLGAGVALQPEEYPPARQRAIVETALRALGADTPRSSSRSPRARGAKVTGR